MGSEGWAGRPQLRFFLYSPRGWTRVSVYREDRILKLAIEGGTLG
ncbi:hypothetical protein FOPG_13406 [Fusarium oxysporum f. sp. conglutinans race 2 54008]|uniref:Uncharacterized protein n=2 Tax=Fusarium oxysporum TaxID=5507 RepID=X0H460_FUSOX|nr:hypothetical protein FOVG_14340 [Fusarium oxysporum f. sp. pisi HDV247]EXL70787.1 hypothetical protein FOPG_13406 [Fusarium oxysporum f. sp. conglutinans race 2 54008]